MTNLIEHPPEGPGVHALIVGVSSYTYLANGEREVIRTYGMGQLDSAAQTAASVAEWITSAETRLHQPIKSLRLLASPSSMEVHPLFAKAQPATRANLANALLDWRDDASKAAGDSTFFYFSGHGIQRARGDSLLLLDDFLKPREPLLNNAIDLSTIYNGMAEPSLAHIPNTQLYFVDACRSDIKDMGQFVSPQAFSPWDITLGGRDDRIAPIFFASSSGNSTYGSNSPGGVSAFGRDFLECMKGGAADKIMIDADNGWAVTIGTLAQALPKFVERYNRTVQGRPRSIVVDKFTRTDPIIATLDQAPEVDCRVTFLPANAHTIVDLQFGEDLDEYNPVEGPLENPHRFRHPAGGWIMKVVVPDEHADRLSRFRPKLVTIAPPETEFVINLGGA